MSQQHDITDQLAGRDICLKESDRSNRLGMKLRPFGEIVDGILLRKSYANATSADNLRTLVDGNDTSAPVAGVLRLKRRRAHLKGGCSRYGLLRHGAEISGIGILDLSNHKIDNTNKFRYLAMLFISRRIHFSILTTNVTSCSSANLMPNERI